MARAQRTSPNPDAGRTDADWSADYSREHGSWTDFTKRLEQLVRDLLARHKIDVVQIESRTKEVESFTQKLKRKAGKYSDPLTQVTDLAGLRVITYYIEDVDAVVALLRKEFAIDPENSRGLVASRDPDRFGYQSAQYVLRLSPERAALAEWEPFEGRCAEIQIRTALQHGWSAIDHKLNYKAEREVPRHLKRRLSRLSALLELADEEFAALRDATKDIAKEYRKEIARGHLDLDVDAASLDAYLDVAGTAKAWVAIAVDVGYSKAKPDAGRDRRDKRDLLFAIQRCEIKTIAELDGLLDSAKDDSGRAGLRAISVACEPADFELFAAPFDVLTLVVLYGRRESPEMAEEIGYKPEIVAALMDALGDKE
jgi:ppGpp synthetase/RelA/SpoT-type nucleotidyltranferase